MITETKRDLKLLKIGKSCNHKETIHILVLFNTYAKLSELNKRIIKLQKQSTPIIRYRTRMIKLEPYWFQFKKKKKYWEKYNLYSKIERKLVSEIKRLEVIYKRERKQLIK
jgi:hypothetical protein